MCDGASSGMVAPSSRRTTRVSVKRVRRTRHPAPTRQAWMARQGRRGKGTVDGVLGLGDVSRRHLLDVEARRRIGGARVQRPTSVLRSASSLADGQRVGSAQQMMLAESTPSCPWDAPQGDTLCDVGAVSHQDWSGVAVGGSTIGVPRRTCAETADGTPAGTRQRGSDRARAARRHVLRHRGFLCELESRARAKRRSTPGARDRQVSKCPARRYSPGAGASDWACSRPGPQRRFRFSSGALLA